MGRPKSKGSPSPWHMRIWDEDKKEWLCESDPHSLTYYGFDIRGGEVTMMQSMDWLYKEIFHGRKLIWERSTGLKDKNKVEIYGGDIVVRKDRIIDHAHGDKEKDIWMAPEVVGIGEEGMYFADEKYYSSDGKFGFKQYWHTYREWCPWAEVKVIGHVHENMDLLRKEGRDE